MTVPTNGLFNGLFTHRGNEILADIFTGESSDVVTKLKIGYGTTVETSLDTDLAHKYTDGGFEAVTVTPTCAGPPTSTLSYTHVFTNTSGVARTVREVGLFTDSSDELVYRNVFTQFNFVNNFCVVRAGETITVTIAVYFTDSTPTYTQSYSPPGDSIATVTYAITVTAFAYAAIEGDTQAKMKIGYGYTAVSGSDTDCEHPYTDYGFAAATLTSSDGFITGGTTRTFTNTFTSSNATERVVREVALFTLLDEFLCRVVFDENDIENLCYVPAGKQIDVSVVLTYGYFSIYSSCDATGDIDLTTFAHPGPIDYNGIVLPNAVILPYDDAMGKKVWQFRCSTKTVADREKVIRYAGPISTGRSATGKQYVISSYRSGVLYISGDNTYYNVYMSEPVSVETFGQTYFFTVTVYESAYPEVV